MNGERSLRRWAVVAIATLLLALLRQVVTTADKEDPEWARPLRRTA